MAPLCHFKKGADYTTQVHACGGNADFLLSTYAHKHSFVLAKALECF